MPSDKRARQRAGRAARMSQLQRTQQRRRRNHRVIPIVVLAVIGAITLAIVTSSGGSKKVKTSTSGPTTTGPTTTNPTATTASGPTTTLVPGTTPGLLAHPAPAISAACHTPASGIPGAGAAPASGKAVSIVPAPQHVPFPALDGSSPRYTKFSAMPPFCTDVAKTYTASMTTDIGVVTIELLAKNAPLTVNNFIFLAGYHYYDGIVFHRVVQGFMDQGGDPTATGGGGPGYAFKDELPSRNAAYTTGALAMANSGPNTNGSQFFMVVPGGGAQLQPLYSVFGQVTSGIGVVEKINSDGNQTGANLSKYHKILKITITES